MRNVFEQVMMVDGSRRMRGDIIQKTFKVRICTSYVCMYSEVKFRQLVIETPVILNFRLLSFS